MRMHSTFLSRFGRDREMRTLFVNPDSDGNDASDKENNSRL